MQFSELSLDRRLLQTLDHLGFEQATQIQQDAIPVVLAGRDLMASSKTGSGKTLAFLLPALQRMMRSKALSKQDARVLVLTPTRELAKQVFGQLRTLLANTNYTGALIVGGEDFNVQSKTLRKNPEIIVATPGRFADHLLKRHVFLNGLELLIFDEADRMLDLGFAAQLKMINQAADHRKRQTLLFSATLDNDIVNEYATELLKNPEHIQVGFINEQHEDISQSFYLCDHLDHKEALLDKLLEQHDVKQGIIFTATREDTDRLAKRLAEQGYSTLALSGELTQSDRNRIMQDFKHGKAQLLVTTDIASRGLDLLGVSHVFNFDMPKHAEEYIHRIGRTGRAGAKGIALSLVGPKDWPSYQRIDKLLKQELKFDVLEGLEGKFKGFRDRPKKKAADSPWQKKRKPQAKKQAKPRGPVRKQGKAFHTGVESGDAPVLRRKKPAADQEE